MISVLKNHPIVWELRRLPLWQNLRYEKSTRQSHAKEVKFYKDLLAGLPTGSLLDIGANTGSKTEIFQSLPERVVAIEPAPGLGKVLRSRFKFRGKVKILDCAVSGTDGISDLYVFEGDESYNTLAPEWASALRTPQTNRFGLALTPRKIEVQTRTLAGMVREYAPIKYIKIDAEGFEYEIISSLDRPVPLISLEFNLPEFSSALERTIDKLTRLSGLYHFNAAITEPPFRLELARWLKGEEFHEYLRHTGWNYVELFAQHRSQ